MLPSQAEYWSNLVTDAIALGEELPLGMRLFDEYERSDTSRSPESEALFTFLNRSSRSDVRNIRAELERWFESYPADDQAQLLSKFQNRRQHGSAWWELYLYRLFTRLGFEVGVHPEL